MSPDSSERILPHMREPLNKLYTDEINSKKKNKRH